MHYPDDTTFFRRAEAHMITGVMLAGGQSSRFGRPKMFEIFKGQPLYEVGVDAFRTLHFPVVIATNDELIAQFQAQNVRYITDEKMYEGPLYALANVMQQIDSDWYFMIAADMPYVHADFIAELSAHISDDYDAVIPTENGKWQPLAGLYHRRTLPKALAALNDNRRSMKALLENVRVLFVAINDPNVFKNINYVEDWPQQEGDA